MIYLPKISKSLSYFIAGFISLLLNVQTSYAQKLDVKWTTTSEVGWGNQIPFEAIDSKGNIYLLGYFKDTITISIDNKPTKFIAQSSYQRYLQKLNAEGETQWLNFLDSNTYYIPSTFTISDKDELSVLSSNKDESSSKKTYYYTAISEEGKVKLKKPIFIWSGDYPHVFERKSVAGVNGNSFHLFLFEDTITFENNERIIDDRGEDHLLIKINHSGEVDWYNHIKMGTRSSTLSADEQGNVYVGGQYNYSLILDNDTTKRVWRNGSNGFIARYNDSGSQVDQFHIGSSKRITISGISATNNGDLYISGTFYGELDLMIKGDSIPKQPYGRAFLLKTNRNFEPQWARYLGDGNEVDGLDIFINSKGTVNWIGYVSEGLDIDPTAEVKHLPNGTFFHQYSDQGEFIWSGALIVDPTHHRARIIPTDGDIFFIHREGYTKISKFKNSYQLEFSKVENGPFDQTKSLYLRNCEPFTWEATGKTYFESGTYYTRGKKDSLRFELVAPNTEFHVRGLELIAVEPEANYSWHNVSKNWEQVGQSGRYTIKETGSYALIVSSKECPKVDTSEFIFKEVAQIPDSILSRFYKPDMDVTYDKIEREHIQLDPKKVDMIPFRQDKLFGFVEKDQPEKWLIQPQFIEVYAIYPEGAIVKDSNYRKYIGGYGLTNKKGEYLIPPLYENLFKEKEIYHGISIYVSDTALHLRQAYSEFNRHDYYNTEGELLFSENSHQNQSFQNENYAWFRFGTTYHIRNLKGELVKSFEWEADKHFVGIADDLLIFKKDNRTEAYSFEDELIFNLPFLTYSKIYRLSDNLFGLMSTQTNDYYFVDSLGKRKSYGNISSSVGFFMADERFFDQENFIVHNKEQTAMGMVNLAGDVLLDFKYQRIHNLSSGVRICLDTNQRWTIIDSIGNTVYEYKRRETVYPYPINDRRKGLLLQDLSFHEGWSIGLGNTFLDAYLLDTSNRFSNLDYDEGQYYYYYNTEGEIQLTLPTDIQLAGYFSDGLAPAIDSTGNLGFIDKSGKWAIAPKYELMFAGAYPFPYPVIPQFINGYAYIKSFKGYVDRSGREYFAGEQLKDSYNFSH